MTRSTFAQSTFASPLQAASVLKPKGGSRQRALFADLLLTALIDAFSILVIFLLMSFSSTGDFLKLNNGVELPKAALGRDLQPTPVVRTEKGRLYLDDIETTPDGLVAALAALKKRLPSEGADAITIQSDRRTAYAELSPVVAALSQTGFRDIQFAVMAK